MKKTGSILLALLLLCSIFVMAVPTSAANAVSLQLSANQESVRVGDTVEITVSLSSGSELGTLQFYLQYDASAVELDVSKSAAQNLFGMESVNWNLQNSIKYVGIASGVVTAGGPILKATFTVKKANPKFSLTVEKATGDDDGDIAVSVGSAVTLKCKHRYGDWVVTQQPTCHSVGTKERTCSDCGAKESATVAMLAHTPGAWETVREATCTEAGERVQKCTVCGAVCKRESIPALGHNIPASAWKVTKEPTCESTGIRTAACTRCGHTVSESIPALGHDIPDTAWKVTKEPGCETTGTRTAACTRCGKTVSESIPALGHDIPDNAWKVTKEPDCETPGIHTAACTRCGKTVTEEIAPSGHNIPESSWTIVTEAGCETPGVRQGVCSICGKTVTEEIPPRDHDFGEWQIVREPTETEPGEKERVCKICGAKETESIDPITAVETAAEPEEPHKTVPKWAVAAGIGAGICAILCIAAVVWVFIAKKKQTK
ncbi:MAG: cohesin domain-containing protein [Candidatus Fimenecus sp.]